jgi:hypothetical protein
MISRFPGRLVMSSAQELKRNADPQAARQRVDEMKDEVSLPDSGTMNTDARST